MVVLLGNVNIIQPQTTNQWNLSGDSGFPLLSTSHLPSGAPPLKPSLNDASGGGNL